MTPKITFGILIRSAGLPLNHDFGFIRSAGLPLNHDFGFYVPFEPLTGTGRYNPRTDRFDS